jgi:hypothetical protein
VSAVVLDVTAADASGPGYLTVYPASEAEPVASVLDFTTGEAVTDMAEVGVDALGDVAVSTDAASVQVVVDVVGYAGESGVAGPAGEPGPLVPLVPTRICDTRPSNPSGLSGAYAQCEGKAPGSSTPLVVNVAGLGGVPSSGATAAVMNLTVTGSSEAGYVTVYPAGSPAPLVSSASFGADETVATRVLVPLGSGGAVEVSTDVSSVQVILDVDGYVSAAGSSGSSGTTSGSSGTSPASAASTPFAGEIFSESSPVRICDTRPGNPSRLSGLAAQCNGRTLEGGEVLSVQAAGLAGVPSGSSGILATVTVTGGSESGYLTIYPPGSRPVASDLNWVPGETIANFGLISLGSDGSFDVYDSSGSVNVVIDVLGWVY